MVAQLYSSMYYAVFFLVYAAAIGVGLVLIYKPPLRQVVIPIVIGAVLAAFVALPLERAFVAGAPMKGARETKEIALYSATPSDYFRASRYSVLWRDRLRAPLAERTLFPGVAPLALAAIAAAPPLRAMPLVYVAGLLVSFDGSLGINGTSGLLVCSVAPAVPQSARSCTIRCARRLVALDSGRFRCHANASVAPFSKGTKHSRSLGCRRS